MGPCVYTTQYPIWLNAALACDLTDEICFHSSKKWATAKKLLDRHGTLPLLIRRQEDETEDLVCRFLADLLEIHFRLEFENDADRWAWLDEKLWFQREEIKRRYDRTSSFPTWEQQYKTEEVDNFMKSTTWYVIRNLREIKPLPLPRFRKLDGDHPLASNYIRGYALCHYPAGEIEVIPSTSSG